MEPDTDGLFERARAARAEAERLDQLAHEITTQAAATCARHQVLPLSPTVEARLHAERGPLACPRDVEPAARELYDELTDWHSTPSATRADDA